MTKLICRAGTVALTFAANPLWAQTAPALPDMELRCDIHSTVIAPDGQAQVTASNSMGGSASGTATTSARTTVSGTLRLRIQNGQGTVFVPPVFLPDGMGTKDGWRPVRDLKATDTDLSGQIRFGLLASSRFNVDRRTGDFNSSGGSQGTCDKVDPSAAAKF